MIKKYLLLFIGMYGSILMAHTSEADLHKKLIEVESKIKKGSYYYHYRNPELLYKVCFVSLNEETEEILITYQAQYGKKLPWTRSLTKWEEMVPPHEGISDPKSYVPRFQKVIQ